MIPRSRRNLFSFRDNDTAGTKAGKSHASGALHAKEEVGWGGGAPGMVQCRGNEEMGKRLWVSAWCLRDVSVKV